MNQIAKFCTVAFSLVLSSQAISNVLSDDIEKPVPVNEKETRFIPVELFTGVSWDGKHELKMHNADTVTCASSDGKYCDKYHVKGPFKTKENHTKITWAGDQLSYFQRTFSTPSRGGVESHFTINQSKDGLVRIYDKRKRWGERTYSGLSSKFPLGYWHQGEVRHYGTKKPVRIEIVELSDENNCLTFRWILGEGKRGNTDNNYTFCPNKGLVRIAHNN